MIACNNEKNFVSAHVFNPNRWLNSDDSNCRSEDIGTNLVVPFGVGKRTCPGKRFVEMELTLLLAKVLYGFWFRHAFFIFISFITVGSRI